MGGEGLSDEFNSRSTGWRYDWSEDEARKNLLRTHTTAASSRTLYQIAQLAKANGGAFQPQKYFSIDRVFRNEVRRASAAPASPVSTLAAPPLPPSHASARPVPPRTPSPHPPPSPKPRPAPHPPPAPPRHPLSAPPLFPQALDATHLAEFHQVEGFVIDRNLSLGRPTPDRPPPRLGPCSLTRL